MKTQKKKNLERNKQILIRFTKEEYETFNKKAIDLNMTKSDLLRFLILLGREQNKSVLSDEEFEELISDIHNIGTRTNQIAKRANQTGNVTQNDLDELDVIYLDFIDIYRKWSNIIYDRGSNHDTTN